MKKIILFTLTLANVIVFVSCKTTEANYRSAYEKAVAARDEDDVENTGQLATKYAIEGSDTIAIAVEHVSPVEIDGVQPRLNAYAVVVGKFRQRFNAMSLRTRLAEAGYEEALVAATAHDGYYIISSSYTTAKEAKAEAERLEVNPPVALGKGMPFILHDPRRKK